MNWNILFNQLNFGGMKIKHLNNIILYLVCLFIIDMFKIMNLADENIIRRIIHMYNRRDYISYKDRLEPYAKPLKKFLDDEDFKKLQSIKTNNNKDTPWFSRKNTSTHMYDNMNDKEKIIFEELTEKIRVKCENILGTKLYHPPDNSNRFYTYYGNNSHHYWHVDPDNKPVIYNVILGIEVEGEISPFQYKDENKKIHTIETYENDGVLFRGGTTIHQVPKNNDPNSKRKVLALAFHSTLDIKRDKKTLCTFIEGGNNILNIVKILLMVFIINLVIGYITDINLVSNKTIAIIILISIIFSRYINLKNSDIGTGRNTSIVNNLILLIFFMVMTLSFKRGSLFLSYFLLTETFFPSKLVMYD
jgi:hypothetical protein